MWQIHTLRFILYVLLLIAIINAIVKHFRHEKMITWRFEKDFKMPSLTFYPIGPNVKKLQSSEDQTLMHALAPPMDSDREYKLIARSATMKKAPKSTRMAKVSVPDPYGGLDFPTDYVITALAYIGKTSNDQKADVTNFNKKDEVAKNFAVNLTEVWPDCLSQGYQNEELAPTRCVTFNPINFKTTSHQDVNHWRLEFLLDFTIADKYWIELHDMEQNRRNRKPDLASYIEISNKNDIGYIQYELKQSQKVDKCERVCRAESVTKMAMCVDQVHSKFMQCQLPWMSNDTSRRVCDTKDDLDIYHKIAAINQEHDSHELRFHMTEEKCMPNCIENTWTFHLLKTMNRPNTNAMCGVNCTIVAFSSDQREIRVREENLAYPLLRLFAEVGGYVALLIGESIFCGVESLVCLAFGKRPKKVEKRRALRLTSVTNSLKSVQNRRHLDPQMSSTPSTGNVSAMGDTTNAFDETFKSLRNEVEVATYTSASGDLLQQA